MPAETGRAAVCLLQRDLRNGQRHGRLSRHRLQPVHRRRRAAGGGKGEGSKAARFRVRGISAADRLHARRAGKPRQAAATASTRASRRSTSPADLVDGLDAFHKQALEILRSDKTKKAFNLAQEKRSAARTLRHRRRSARARWPRGGWSKPASASSPSAWAAGTRTARTSTPFKAAAAAARSDAVGPDQRPERPRHARQHHRLLRRRIRPHAEDQQERRPRSLGPVDGGASWPAAASSAATPTAPPTPTAWPRPPSPARRTMSRPRSSTASASTRTRSCRPRRAGRSSCSAKARYREVAGLRCSVRMYPRRGAGSRGRSRNAAQLVSPTRNRRMASA